jgi:hypothetical protein
MADLREFELHEAGHFIGKLSIVGVRRVARREGC